MTAVHYPQTLTELGDLLAGSLRKRLDPAVAVELARELVEEVRAQWGGSLVYIPQGARYARQQRDAAILREFNGRNHADLAKRYRLSLSYVYDILASQRSRETS